ncbi:hypothetical protein BDZ97DRAFT_1423631 [Flammula alnicola]|nr:hypothetical protein BDZ97DRAFT_1423631 [Flammula alnicola]
MGRSAYDFERYAYQDLRKYLKSFELPKPLDCDPREILLMLARPDPPFMGHVKRLTITNEPWRILENIRPLALKEALVLTWLNSSIPVEPVHKIDMQDPPYTLPQILSDKFFSYKRSDAEEMKSWLMLPVVTATRVMHTAFPQTTGWVFKAEEEETADSSWFQCARWTPRVHNPGPEEQPVPVRLVMAFQTPFVLNEQDMHAFSACTAFPPYNMGPTNGLPSKYRLWAKIWDTCYSNNCRWFVLTSYTQWVFGVFSKTMRTAFLSSIYKYDSTSPTILELLTYWIASSMGMQVPSVPYRSRSPSSQKLPWVWTSSMPGYRNEAKH